MRVVLTCVSMLILVCSCAANSGIVPTGQNTYMVSRQAATGFGGAGTLKADALREANAYCESRHQMMEVISSRKRNHRVSEVRKSL